MHSSSKREYRRARWHSPAPLVGIAALLAFAAVALPASAQTGLEGEYFQWSGSNDRTNVFSPAFLKYYHVDPNVDFDWTTLAPDMDVDTGITLGVDNFAVRWVGQVTAPASEDFMFHTASDDASRLWISPTPIDPANPGTPTVDNWACCADKASAPVTLVKGTKYYVLMEAREDGGGANAHLSWESPSTPLAPIPTEALTPGQPDFTFATISGTITAPPSPAGSVVVGSGPKSLRAVAGADGKYTITNAIPGTYTLTSFQPGVFGPKGISITVASGDKKTQDFTLDQEVIVTNYPLQYDHDWINSADATTDYTVVNNAVDAAYDKDTLPKTGEGVKAGNLSFPFPPTETGKNNVVALSLNTFLFGKAHYTALDILAASGGSNGGGTYIGQVTLTYDDGSSQVVPITVTDYSGGTESVNEVPVVQASGLTNDGTVVESLNIYYQTISVDPSKVLVSAAFSSPLAGSSTVATPEIFGLLTESAETPQPTATLSGVVSTATGPATGAVVRVGPLSVTTPASGAYSFALPAGTYTVGALLPGKLAPVVQNVTVAAGESKTLPLSLTNPVVELKYPLNYSQDWVSGADATADYTFGDSAFIAEQLPITNGAASFGDIPFSMGDTSEGGQNIVFVNGQTLPVPEGNYSALYFLESCVSGSYTRDWTLNFTDGTSEKVNVQFTDWCGGASKLESEWKRTVNRHNAGGEAGPNCAIFYEPRFINNFTKTLKSITLNADPDGYGTNSGGMFALTLEAGGQPAVGTISGTVNGPNGPLANAWVVAGYDPSSNSQGSGWVVGKTGADGKFSGSAPNGTYSLSIEPRGSGLKPGTKSVTVAGGQTTEAGTITLASYGTQVVSFLGATNANNGLRQIEPANPDAASQPFVTTAASVGGKNGRSATKIAFDVDDNFIYRGLPDPNATIRIQYYDAGTDTINLVYNSSDLTLGNGDGKYQVSVPIIDRTNTNTWLTADLTITDAGFFGTQPVGGDFRIESASSLTLGYVVVATGATVTDPGTPPVTTVKGDLNGDGKVNIGDATLALQISVGNITPSAAQTAAGDVINVGDGIKIGDVIKILQVAVGNGSF